MAFHVTASYIQHEREREAAEARLAGVVRRAGRGRPGFATRTRAEVGGALIALGRFVGGEAVRRRGTNLSPG